MNAGAAPFLALDVAYADTAACVAGVWFDAWTDAAPACATALRIPGPARAYRPGAFYRRELPLLMDFLAAHPAAVQTVIIDGYVWLRDRAPGLGAHLFRALGERTPVIGVAKSPFRGDTDSIPILRGGSQRPLHITAAGMPSAHAAAAIGAMHGAHRIPTLLKVADSRARRGLSAA